MADEFNMESGGGSGNLFKDITRGLFREVMPVASTTIDSGRDVMSEFRNLSRKLTGTMRQESRKVSKTYQGRQATAAFDTAMHDIANGTFDVSKVNNSMYDDYDDIEKTTSIDALTADEQAAMPPEEMIMKGQQGISRAVIRSASAQMDAMMGIAQSIMGSNISATRALGQQITNSILYNTNTINANLMVANGKLSQINANLETLIEYQNVNTTKFYEKNLEVMSAMAKMMTNFESMDTGKQRKRTNMRARSGFDFREYARRIKTGLKSSIFATGASMAKTSMGMSTPGENIASIISMFLPEAWTKPLKTFDKNLGQNFEEILKRIGDKTQNNILMQMLGLADVLGNKRSTVGKTIGMYTYQKDAIPWNGKAQRALVEVIPELLTSIDAGINKTDKRYYDYETGRFQSRKEIEKAFDDEYFSRISFELDGAISKIAKAIESAGVGDADKQAARGRISDIVHDRAFGNVNVIESRQEMADILSSLNVSTGDFTSIMRDFERSLDSVTESMEDLYDKIGSTDSIYRVVNNRSGSGRRTPIGRTSAETLSERAKQQSIFSRNYMDQNINDSVNAIVDALETEFPEETIDGAMKREIYSDILNGADEQDVLKRFRNQLNRGKGMGKILDFITRGDYSARRQQRNQDTVRSSRYRDSIQRADDELFLRTFGIRYNEQGPRPTPTPPTPTPPVPGPGPQPPIIVPGGPRPQSGPPVPIPYGGGPRDSGGPGRRDAANQRPQPQIRSVNALGDTTLQNKRASSQRSDMDGDVAGAEAAHRRGSDTETGLITSTHNPNMSNALDSLEGAITAPFARAIDQPEGALNLNERNRAEAVDALSDIPEQSGSIGQAIKGLMDTTRVGMTTMLSSFTDFGSRLFGKQGMLRTFFESDFMKQQMTKLRDKLFNEKDGIFKDQIAWLKSTGKGIWEGTKDELAKGYNWVYDQYYINKYGEGYRDKDEWKQNAHAQKMDWGTRRLAKKSSVNSPEDTLDETAEEVEVAMEPIADKGPDNVVKTSINTVTEAAQEGAEKIKSSLIAVADTIAEDDAKESKQNKIKSINSSLVDAVKKGAPKVLAGGIAGLGVGALTAAGGSSLLGAMFLPGGPIGGAIVGSGIALLSQTEAFKSFMFGKKSEKDGERSGGLISKKMREGFKKAAPIAVGGAALGVLKSLIKIPLTGGGGLGVLGMQLLPGGILGGAVLGMGLGLLKNSDLMQNTLFGKKKDGSENALAKGYGKVKELFKGSGKAVTNGLKGAGIGALTGVVLSNMGFLPAMLSLGGPIGMGVAGLGIGIASSTKHFNEWMFGTEELDEDGNPTGKRKGGMLTRVRNILTVNVIDPITDSFRENMLKFLDWGKDKITLPFRSALGPILDSITGIKDNIVDYMKDKFDMIGEGVKSALTGAIKSIFSPVTKLVGTIGRGAMSALRIGAQAALAPVQIGLGALNFMTMGKRRKEYGEFYKQYYAKGNINKNLNEYWAAQEADGNKVGFLGRMADRMSAYMGRGPIADAAREGYNEEMAAAGKDHLKWRGVPSERRELKEERKRRNESFKQWKRIDKLRKSITNNDLEGEETELTPAMFERYKKKFVDLGIDESLLQTNDDLMQLIYHKSDFRKRAAGDSGKLGESMALTQFRTALNEEMRTEEQLQKMDTTNELLSNISDQFRQLADNVLFDRQSAGYMEERKEDTKRLRRRLKKMYKTDLWGDTQKIDLKDPELLEYDLSGIDNTMLREYAASKFAENGDFKGFLDAYGRKMSPDDVRREWTAGRRLSPHNTRTHSTTPEGENASGGNGLTDAINNLVDNVQRQTNINAAQLESTTGGEINADDVADRRGRSFGTRIMNKFSNVGFFGNLFKRKQKTDKDKARSDREAAESAAAQSLGDEEPISSVNNPDGESVSGEDSEKEETNPIMKALSTVKNVLGGAVGAFANTKAGSFITSGIKFAGALGLVAGVGLTIAELVKPGIGETIGNKISDWNKNVEDNLEGDGFTRMINEARDKILNFFTESSQKALDWVTNDFLGADGYLATGIGKVAEVLPDFLTKYVLPGIERTANFIGDNAEAITSAASTIITAIGPPLIETVFKVLPDVLIAAGKGLWSGLLNIGNGNERAKENLTQAEVADIEAKGGAARDKWENASQEEAERAEAQGYEVRRTSTGYQINRQYTLAGNEYENSKGEIETVENSRNKSTIAEFLTHAGANAALGFPGAATTMLKGGAKAVTGGVGSLAGGAFGLLKGGPIGAVTGAVTGGKAGAKLVDLGSKAVGAVKTAGNWLVNTGKNVLGNLFGNKGATDAAATVAAQYSDDAARIIGNATNAAQGNIDNIVRATAEESGTDVVKLVTNVAETGADDVAAAQKNTLKTFLDKATDALKKIPELGPVKKLIEAAGSKAAVITKAVKETVEEWCEKLAKAGQKIASDSKLGKKVISFIADKMAALGIKTASAAATFMISEAVFMTIGGIGGAIDAPNLFGVAKSACDWKMRLIAGLIEAILGSTVGGIIDIVLLVLQMVTGYDAKKEFASFLYKKISFNTDEAEDRLEDAQNQLALETAIYNKVNGTNLTVQAYNELANKTWLGKAADTVVGWFTGNKPEDMSRYAEMAEAYKSSSGSYSINDQGEVKLNTDLTVGYGLGDLTQDMINQIKMKMFGKVLGFEDITARDKAIGYGPSFSPYSQANPAWADMKLGQFASGNTATMATAGCGPTAMAMAARRVTGVGVTPAMVGRYAVANGYISNGGANAGLFTEGAAELGMRSTEVNKGNLSKALQSGSTVIVSGKSNARGPYTSAGHILMAEGTDASGNVIVTDPTDGRRKKYTMNQMRAGMTAGWKYDNGAVGYGVPLMTTTLATGARPTVSATSTGGTTTTPATPTIPMLPAPGLLPNSTLPTSSLTSTLNSYTNDTISALMGGTPDSTVVTKLGTPGVLMKVTTDGKTYWVPMINGYKYNASTMCYESLTSNKSVPIMDIINHTAQLEGYSWNSSQNAYVTRSASAGGYSMLHLSDFDGPLNAGPVNTAATVYKHRSGTYATTDTSATALDTATLDAIAAESPGTIQDFLDDFNTKKGFAKLLCLGRLMEAIKNSIMNGTSVWDEYKTLAKSSGSSSSSESGITGDATIITGSNTEETIWKTLRGAGLSAAGTAGTMGNLFAESGLNPTNLQNSYERGLGHTDASYTAAVNNGAYTNFVNDKAGYGLAQWTYWSRKKNLLDFAKSKGASIGDPGMQIQFLLKELESYGLLPTLKSATDVQTASNIVLTEYEKPAGYSRTSVKNTRASYSQGYYDKYAGVAGYGPGDEGTDTETKKPSFKDISGKLTSQVVSPIYQKLFELTGIDLGNTSSTTADGSTTLSGTTTNFGPVEGANETQSALVNKMRSVYGQLDYSLDWDKQNPDNGVASCASTVGWAYSKVLGINDMSANSGLQAKHGSFTTVWTKNKADDRLPIDILQPGDVLYQDWKRGDQAFNPALKGYLDGYQMSHTEMYAGDGKDLSHGGPDKGPVFKELNDYRRRHTMIVRRYNGFIGSNAAGYGPGDEGTEDTRTYQAKPFILRDIERTSESSAKMFADTKDTKPIGFGGTTVEMAGTETRLEKILDIISQWYLESKKTVPSNTTNIVDASTRVVSTTKPKLDAHTAPAEVIGKIDSLVDRHSKYASAY